MTPQELENYTYHDQLYFRFGATVSTQEACWYLSSDRIPNYYDINRVMHLRDDGRGPKAICDEIFAYFTSAARRVVVDLDAVAEEQGFGQLLRAKGVMPVTGSYVAMRWVPGSDRPVTSGAWLVREIDTNFHECDAWADLAGCDETTLDEREFWRAVGQLECSYPPIKKIGVFAGDGELVGACSLFLDRGMARIDSVIVMPLYRHQHVATSLVSYSVRIALERGATCIYLATEKGSVAERIYKNIGFAEWATNPMRRHMSR
jgi:GNAT superfamily N-acetyltransferase